MKYKPYETNTTEIKGKLANLIWNNFVHDDPPYCLYSDKHKFGGADNGHPAELKLEAWQEAGIEGAEELLSDLRKYNALELVEYQ